MSKSIIRWLILIAGLLMFLVPNIALSAQERRIALIIGNGAYKSSYLKNPANDANDIAEALKECQFTTTKLINADRRKIEKAIRDFGNSLKKGDIGLFYFAGHGVQVNGRNYLIPIGSTIETESDVEFEAVDAGRVLGKMQDAGNKINIMILDACRNNPYGSQFRSAKRGLAVIPAPKGALVAYATSPGAESEDGEGRNGLYTSMLLKHIREQGLTVERFFKKTGRDVSIATNYKQVPWIQSSLIEDFYFSPKKGATVVKRPSIEPKKSKTEPPNYASISPDVSKLKVIEDGNFVKFESGVVYDKNANLEWYAGPDRKTNWYDAKKWVENLNVAGGGWRMPTRQELKTLYKKGAGESNMTPLLKTTGWYVWSGETKSSSSVWGFSFYGGTENWYTRDSSTNGRGFAVRSRR
jgi:hypothetical protein